jgi:hypothetical protein
LKRSGVFPGPGPGSRQPPEWRTLALDPATDTPLYRSPRNDPDDTGPAQKRGTDLFAHTAQSGSVYYYLWHWSRRQNETNICQLTTEDSAVQFIREQFGGSATPGDFDHDKLEVRLPGKDRAGVKRD